MEKEIEYITIDFMLFDKTFAGQNIFESEGEAIESATKLKCEFNSKGFNPQISIVFSYVDGEILGLDLDLLIYMNNTN